MPEAYGALQPHYSGPARASRALFSLGLAILFTMAMTGMAFAAPAASGAAGAAGGAGNEILHGVNGGMQQAYNLVKALVIPIGVLVFAVQAFMMFFGGQRGMETAKKGMLVVVLVVGLVCIAPLILTTVFSWFSSVTDGGAFSGTI